MEDTIYFDFSDGKWYFATKAINNLSEEEIILKYTDYYRKDSDIEKVRMDLAFAIHIENYERARIIKEIYENIEPAEIPEALRTLLEKCMGNIE